MNFSTALVGGYFAHKSQVRHEAEYIFMYLELEPKRQIFHLEMELGFNPEYSDDVLSALEIIFYGAHNNELFPRIFLYHCLTSDFRMVLHTFTATHVRSVLSLLGGIV